MCKHAGICYAMKAERQYPNCESYRDRQQLYWHTKSDLEISTDIRTKIFQINSRRALSNSNLPKIKYLRFSEAGDFLSQGDVDKMSKIATRLDGYAVVYGYTARTDLDFSKVSDNMIVNGSDFMLHNLFQVVYDRADLDKTQAICPGDCSSCNLCKERRGLIIQVLKH